MRNMEEVIQLATLHCGQDTQAIATVIGAQLVAEAIARVATVQEKTFEMTNGMMKKFGPMMDNMGDMTEQMKNDMKEGESWKSPDEEEHHED